MREKFARSEIYMKIKDLKANRKNPRKISAQKLKMLKASVEKFGDLSGFVFNRRSGQLVSGHQRSKVLPADAKIVVEKKHEIATRANTVAEGYVEIDGERFKYREVDADAVWETEALLAANKHSGEWDTELLRVLVADVPSIDMSLAGFDAEEMMKLKIEIPRVAVPVAEAQAESDEQYVANTPETSEQIPTGEAGFGAVKEDAMNVVDRRYVIIIDCTSQDHKEALKDKIRPLVTEAGGKFF